MPLIQGQEYLIDSQLPQNITYQGKVFIIQYTGEIFRNYSDYVQKIQKYRSKVWSCSRLGTENLTYKEALRSEGIDLNIHTKDVMSKLQPFLEQLKDQQISLESPTLVQTQTSIDSLTLNQTQAQNQNETQAQNQTETQAQNQTETQAQNYVQTQAQNQTQTQTQTQTHMQIQSQAQNLKQPSKSINKTCQYQQTIGTKELMIKLADIYVEYKDLLLNYNADCSDIMTKFKNGDNEEIKQEPNETNEEALAQVEERFRLEYDQSLTDTELNISLNYPIYQELMRVRPTGMTVAEIVEALEKKNVSPWLDYQQAKNSVLDTCSRERGFFRLGPGLYTLRALPEMKQQVDKASREKNSFQAQVEKQIYQYQQKEAQLIVKLEEMEKQPMQMNTRKCSKCMRTQHSQLNSPLILCDYCTRSYHLACLQINWTDLPQDNWPCPKCQEKHLGNIRKLAELDQKKKDYLIKMSIAIQEKGDILPQQPQKISKTQLRMQEKQIQIDLRRKEREFLKNSVIDVMDLPASPQRTGIVTLKQFQQIMKKVRVRDDEESAKYFQDYLDKLTKIQQEGTSYVDQHIMEELKALVQGPDKLFQNLNLSYQQQQQQQKQKQMQDVQQQQDCKKQELQIPSQELQQSQQQLELQQLQIENAKTKTSTNLEDSNIRYTQLVSSGSYQLDPQKTVDTNHGNLEQQRKDQDLNLVIQSSLIQTSLYEIINLEHFLYSFHGACEVQDYSSAQISNLVQLDQNVLEQDLVKEQNEEIKHLQIKKAEQLEDLYMGLLNCVLISQIESQDPVHWRAKRWARILERNEYQFQQVLQRSLLAMFKGSKVSDKAQTILQQHEISLGQIIKNSVLTKPELKNDEAVDIQRAPLQNSKSLSCFVIPNDVLYDLQDQEFAYYAAHLLDYFPIVSLPPLVHLRLLNLMCSQVLNGERLREIINTRNNNLNDLYIDKYYKLAESRRRGANATATANNQPKKQDNQDASQSGQQSDNDDDIISEDDYDSLDSQSQLARNKSQPGASQQGNNNIVTNLKGQSSQERNIVACYNLQGMASVMGASWIQQVVENQLRVEKLGVDRQYAEYYWTACDQQRIYRICHVSKKLQNPNLEDVLYEQRRIDEKLIPIKEESTYSDIKQERVIEQKLCNVKDESQQGGDSYAQLHTYEAMQGDQKGIFEVQMGFIDTQQELEQLMKSLSPLGFNERLLKSELRKNYGNILAQFQLQESSIQNLPTPNLLIKNNKLVTLPQLMELIQDPIQGLITPSVQQLLKQQQSDKQVISIHLPNQLQQKSLQEIRRENLVKKQSSEYDRVVRKLNVHVVQSCLENVKENFQNYFEDYSKNLIRDKYWEVNFEASNIKLSSTKAFVDSVRYLEEHLNQISQNSIRKFYQKQNQNKDDNDLQTAQEQYDIEKDILKDLGFDDEEEEQQNEDDETQPSNLIVEQKRSYKISNLLERNLEELNENSISPYQELQDSDMDDQPVNDKRWKDRQRHKLNHIVEYYLRNYEFEEAYQKEMDKREQQKQQENQQLDEQNKQYDKSGAQDHSARLQDTQQNNRLSKEQIQQYIQQPKQQTGEQNTDFQQKQGQGSLDQQAKDDQQSDRIEADRVQGQGDGLQEGSTQKLQVGSKVRSGGIEVLNNEFKPSNFNVRFNKNRASGEVLDHDQIKKQNSSDRYQKTWDALNGKPSVSRYLNGDNKMNKSVSNSIDHHNNNSNSDNNHNDNHLYDSSVIINAYGNISKKPQAYSNGNSPQQAALQKFQELTPAKNSQKRKQNIHNNSTINSINNNDKNNNNNDNNNDNNNNQYNYHNKNGNNNQDHSYPNGDNDAQEYELKLVLFQNIHLWRSQGERQFWLDQITYNFENQKILSLCYFAECFIDRARYYTKRIQERIEYKNRSIKNRVKDIIKYQNDVYLYQIKQEKRIQERKEEQMLEEKRYEVNQEELDQPQRRTRDSNKNKHFTELNKAQKISSEEFGDMKAKSNFKRKGGTRNQHTGSAKKQRTSLRANRGQRRKSDNLTEELSEGLETEEEDDHYGAQRGAWRSVGKGNLTDDESVVTKSIDTQDGSAFSDYDQPNKRSSSSKRRKEELDSQPQSYNYKKSLRSRS